MARRMAARLTKTSRTFGVSGSAGSVVALCASGGQGILRLAQDAASVSVAGAAGAAVGFGVAGVHEEVDVALAVAELGVFEAVVLVRQGEHGLGEEGDAGLPSTGPTWTVSSPVRVRKRWPRTPMWSPRSRSL